MCVEIPPLVCSLDNFSSPMRMSVCHHSGAQLCPNGPHVLSYGIGEVTSEAVSAGPHCPDFQHLWP
jgi:hypothetical protein